MASSIHNQYQRTWKNIKGSRLNKMLEGNCFNLHAAYVADDEQPQHINCIHDGQTAFCLLSSRKASWCAHDVTIAAKALVAQHGRDVHIVGFRYNSKGKFFQ